MKYVLITLFFGLTQIGISVADYYCTNYDYDSYYHYCEHGCCDSWPYETCCTNDAWLGWAIAGGVIGGILIISMIVCIFCAVMKKKGKTGRVIQPSNAQGDQPPIYTSLVSHMPAYPVSQGYYPQYTTTSFMQAPTAPPAYANNPPPEYGTLYGQQQQQQQERLPPLPIGFEAQRTHQNNSMT